MQKTVISPRVDFIDLAKGLGMLAIIWGHTRLSGWSFEFVYAWHIPLFFFLSGLVFSRDRYPSLSIFLKKKWNGLLLPYLFYSCFTWIIWVVVMKVTHADIQSYWAPLLETFIARGSGGFMLHNVPLWFPTCLFVMELCYFYLSRLSVWLRIVISVMLAAVSYLLITYCSVVDVTLAPWNLEVMCLALPWFVLGHVLLENVGYESSLNWVAKNRWFVLTACVVGIAVVLLCSNYNGRISYGHAFMGRNVWVSYVGSLLGVAAVVALCMLLSCTRWNELNVAPLRFVKWFGRNSFRVMALHEFMKYVAFAIVSVVGPYSISEIPYHSWPCIFSFVLTLLLVSLLVMGVDSLRRKLS